MDYPYSLRATHIYNWTPPKSHRRSFKAFWRAAECDRISPPIWTKSRAGLASAFWGNHRCTMG